jgi:large subunit ribosomal protein L10Ae
MQDGSKERKFTQTCEL